MLDKYLLRAVTDKSFLWLYLINYFIYFSFWNIQVEALAVKLTQKEGELIQEKFKDKKLTKFLNQVSSWLLSFWLCVCLWFFMIKHVFWMKGCNLKNSKCRHKSIMIFFFLSAVLSIWFETVLDSFHLSRVWSLDFYVLLTILYFFYNIIFVMCISWFMHVNFRINIL